MSVVSIYQWREAMNKKRKMNRGEKHMKAVMKCLLRIAKNWRGNMVGEVSSVEVAMKVKRGYSIVKFTAYGKDRNLKVISFYSYEPEEAAEDALVSLNNVLSWKDGCCLNDIQKIRDRRAHSLTFWRDRG
jgi:hypothetical protein